MDKDEVKIAKSEFGSTSEHLYPDGTSGGAVTSFFAFEWSTQTRKLDETVLVQDVLAEEEIELLVVSPLLHLHLHHRNQKRLRLLKW